ncbi:Endo-1,4-beta-xylanase A precursor [compost metagenome]
MGLELESGDAPFSDIHAGDWYNSAVHTAYSLGIISGFEDGSYRPNDSITREQAMVIIAKAMAVTKLKDGSAEAAAVEALHQYADTSEASGWAMESIAVSVEAGIVSGRNGNQLAPKAYITRAEVAVIVERLLKNSELI